MEFDYACFFDLKYETQLDQKTAIPIRSCATIII